MGHPWTIQSVWYHPQVQLVVAFGRGFQGGRWKNTRYLEMLQKGFGFVCSCSFLVMLLTKHHVLMILWVFTYVPIAAQAVSPWAGSQGSPEFGDVWGAIHHPSDADHTKPYEGIMCLHSGPYSRIILIYTQDIRKNRVPYKHIHTMKKYVSDVILCMYNCIVQVYMVWGWSEDSVCDPWVHTESPLLYKSTTPNHRLIIEITHN